MMELRFEGASAPVILFLGAHCDDIEIGCGGTLLALRERLPDAAIHWVVFSSDEVRERETRDSARRFLGEDPGERLRIESFRDGFLPYSGGAVKEVFEELKQRIHPDWIFTHYRDDLHQDHRLVCELTWNTWRNHVILEYEIPKWDGDLGQPNSFIALSERQVEEKVENLLKAYPSQASRSWFDADTWRAILRLRGVECNAPERHAEAFYARKLVLGI